MNKPVYLGLSILEFSKAIIYEFGYDYMKPKYHSNAKLCYMDTDSFLIEMQTSDVYEGIADNVEKRSGISNYGTARPLLKGKNKRRGQQWWKDKGSKKCATKKKS